MSLPASLPPLLADALALVVSSPHASHTWHKLMARFNEAPSVAASIDMRAHLLAHVPEHGVAGFLRDTFLGNLHEDQAALAAAGVRLQELRPFDAERAGAFIACQWGRAVAEAGDRAGFAARLNAVRLPALVDWVGRQLPAVPLAPRASGHGKVALVLPYFGHASHPPTEMALQQVRLLGELGYAVHLFSAQELEQPDMDHYLGCGSRISAPVPELARAPGRLPPGASLTLGDARFSLLHRWRATLHAIAAFDPDLVMLVGFFSPLLTPLFAARPVVALNVHALAPMAPVDVWLSADGAGEGWDGVFPDALAHHHPYRIARASHGAALDRASLGLEPGQTVLVTVGARLGREIAGAWAARMATLVEEHPGVVWLLVGGDGALPPALAGRAPGRIRAVAHCAHLGSVLACCDIYLNPPRVGGGLSAGEAMAEGLAVLALRDGDAGSKVGELAQPDEAAYFATLARWLAAPAQRAAQGRALRARFERHLDLARAGPSLEQACDLARARFAARCG